MNTKMGFPVQTVRSGRDYARGDMAHGTGTSVRDAGEERTSIRANTALLPHGKQGTPTYRTKTEDGTKTAGSRRSSEDGKRKEHKT